MVLFKLKNLIQCVLLKLFKSLLKLSIFLLPLLGLPLSLIPIGQVEAFLLPFQI